MEIVVLIAFVLTLILPTTLLVIGIQKEKKKRAGERNDMFRNDEIKPARNPKSIDAVAEITKILQDEVGKLADEVPVKPKSKRRKKQIKKKKPEFPIEPTEPIKTKAKRGRKPKNKDNKDGDQMLLS